MSDDALGLLLRDKSVHNPNTGSHWTSSVLFSLVQELAPLWNPVKDTFDGTLLLLLLLNKLNRHCYISFFFFCNVALRDQSIPPTRSSHFITRSWEK